MADIFDFYVYDDRSIRFAIAEPIMLEYKDVTQFRSRIPKVLNNIDMTDWEWWFIFVNAKKVKYTTQLTLIDDEDDPDNFSVATYTVGYGFSGYVGSVSFSIEALNVSGEDIVNEWHTRTYNTTVTDTLQGSRAVIPEPGGQSGTGLTEEIRQALLQIARKVAYIDEHGQTYYNNLYDALYAIQAVTVSPTRVGLTTIGATSQLIGATVPSGGTITWASSNTAVATVSDTGLVTSVGYGTATITATSGGKSATCSVVVAQAQLESITAVYTQSGTVYDTDTLDSLKPDLVVTAYYDNQTSAVVTDYTLSGTLTEGTSTITVSYGGETDTFDVTVTHQDTPVNYLYNWDFTQSLVDTVGGVTATLGHASTGTDPVQDSTGVLFNGPNQYCLLGTMQLAGRSFEFDIAEMSVQVSNQHTRVFMCTTNAGQGTGALIWRQGSGYNYWSGYSGSTWSSPYSDALTALGRNGLAGKTVKISFDLSGHPTIYVDGENMGTGSVAFTTGSNAIVTLGNITGATGYSYNMRITGMRIYANA